jgi:hypothetical protein
MSASQLVWPRTMIRHRGRGILSGGRVTIHAAWYGDMRTYPSPFERLYSRCARSESGCLEWQGPVTWDGYGQIFAWGKPWKAHRLAYTLRHGPIPEGAAICHKCDNPRCIELEHLYAGTQLSNVSDMLDRGRHVPRGGGRLPDSKRPVRRARSTHWRSKLGPSESDAVATALAAGEPVTVIAARFGVHRVPPQRLAGGASRRRRVGPLF